MANKAKTGGKPKSPAARQVPDSEAVDRANALMAEVAERRSAFNSAFAAILTDWRDQLEREQQALAQCERLLEERDS